MSDYDIRPGGSLKFKGNQEAKAKKRKRKRKDDGEEARGEKEEPKKLKLREGFVGVSQSEENAGDGSGSKSIDDPPSESDATVDTRTDAEIRFENVRLKRIRKRVEEYAKKSHKDRVDEFNKKLEALSEHHDIPKVGPG